MFTVGNVDRYISRRSGRQSIDTRSILDRHSVDCRSRVDQLSIECRSSIDRESTDMYVGRHSFSGHRYLADTLPILGRHLTDTWPTLPPILDQYIASRGKSFKYASRRFNLGPDWSCVTASYQTIGDDTNWKKKRLPCP